MEKQSLIALGVLALIVTLSFSASGAYSADYTVSDLDDIVIDLTGTAMVEVKGDIGDIVDISILYLIVVLLVGVLTAIVALVLVPKKLKPKNIKGV